jgi:cell shape-determining protein MreC
MKNQIALSLWCLGLATTTCDGFLVVGPSSTVVLPIDASSGRRFGKSGMDSSTGTISRRYTALFDNTNAIEDETQSSQTLQQDEDIVRELMEEMQMFEEQLATVEEELATIREEWASLTDKPLSSGNPQSAPKMFWSA